ncbi:MAG: TIGR03617 family F420-dependent LLM class oxidoreductase [Acidimicrobiia bacterium]
MKVDQTLQNLPSGSFLDIADYAVAAESLGFDGIFTAETGHDPFLPIAAAAGETSSIELGTAIAVAFARSPMTIAYTAWDLAEATSGRLLLGLGTQIKAHIERRFNMPWSSPGPRMREYIAALRAIWHSWQTGERLRFSGDFYEFSLMTPFFSPQPMAHSDIPIYIAGVGDYMCRVAGEAADGFHVHPFHTLRYLTDVVMPNIEKGAALADRAAGDVELATGVLVISGRTEEELAASRLATKIQIAFYASTPAYRGVLDLHGWDFGSELTAMSKRGEWMAMGEVIPDEIVDELAVTAPLESLGQAVREKYEGALDRVGFYFSNIPGQSPLVDPTDEEWSALVAGVRG